MPPIVKAQQVERSRRKPISKLSLASFVALAAGVLLLALTIAIVLVDNRFIAGMTGRPARESLTVHVVSFSSYALPAISILGGGLGIAGLLYQGRGENLAWLSVAGNAAMLLLVCTFLTLSLLFEGYMSTP